MANGVNTKKIKHIVEPDIHREDLKKSLNLISKCFSDEWLELDSNHPLSILWKRDDPSALSELHSFGDSIGVIKDKDHNWIKQKIKDIKDKDRGAVFEILAAASIENGKNHEVLMPPAKNSGYDLIIKFNDGARINVSCKKHKRSDHKKLFDEFSEKFRKRFVYMCKNMGLKDIQCHIIFKIYPEYPQWDLLEEAISFILIKTYIGKLSNELRIFKINEYVEFEFGDCIIRLWGMPEIKNKISEKYMSYNILITAPFHKNDLQNLKDHIDDGCDNLTKHGVEQNGDEINIIFISLGEDHSLDNCEKWSRNYLDNNNDKPIAGILLIKPILVTDLEKSNQGIYIGCRLITNDKYSNFSRKGERLVNLEFPVAKGFGQKDYDYEIMTEQNGKFKLLGTIVDEIYFYQKGKFYFKYSPSAKISSIAHGIENFMVKETSKGLELHCLNINPDHNFYLL